MTEEHKTVPETEASNSEASKESFSLRAHSSLVANLRPLSPPTMRRPFKSGKKLSVALIVLAITAALIGATAGAYYGIIVPNKPENVLKNAFSNTLSQTQTTFNGLITYESTNGNAKVKAVDVSFTGSSDTSTNAFQTTTEITASGVKVPLELRKVDKNLYFKVGDLGGLKNVAEAASPTYGTIVDAVNQKIANQWVEVDDTLLKQAKADCVLNTSYAFTNQDIQLLQDRFNQVPFAAIKSHTNDTVNGHGAIKYSLDLNDDQLVTYVRGLQNLSIVNKLKQCNSGLTSSSITPAADDQLTPLTLWVDKNSKRIVKITSQTTPQDEARTKVKLSFEITLSYGPVSISKPAGAKSFMDIFGDFTQLFSGLNQASTSPLNLTAPSLTNVPNVSQACLDAVQAYANSHGTTTIPADCL